MQQPTTAENVAKRFGNYLIGEDVKTENISKIIKDFETVTYNQVLYKGFKSSEQYLNCAKYGSRLLDPCSLVSKTISLIGSQHPNNFSIGLKILTQMGQRLLEPQIPRWPFGDEWLSSQEFITEEKAFGCL